MSDIIILGGKYEVHPAAAGDTWCVVNSDTGRVRNEAMGKNDAVELATELNLGADK